MKKVLKKFHFMEAALVLMVALGFTLQFQFAGAVLTKQTEENLELGSKNAARMIEGWLEAKGEVVESAALYLQLVEDEEQTLALLKEQMSRHEDFFSLYFGTTENQMINASGWIPPAEFDLRNRPWYIEAVEKGSRINTSVFLNASKDHYIMTIATPVYDKAGELKGVMAGDITLHEIVAFVRDQRISENGYAFLMDGEGTLLTHRNSELDPLAAPRHIEAVSPKLSRILALYPEGIHKVDMNQEKGMVAYSPIVGTNWVVAGFVPRQDYPAAENHLFLIFMATVLFTVTGVLFLISRQRKENEKELVASNTELSSANQQLVAAEQSLSIEMQERKAAQKELEMILSLLSDAEEIVFILDEDYRCIYSNQSFRDMMQMPEAELARRNLVQEGKILNQELMKDVLKEGYWTGEQEYPNTEGEPTVVFMRVNHLMYGSESYFTGILTDITRYRQREKELDYFKYFDPLTGLHNSRFLREHLEKFIHEHISHNEAHALILLNIDDFRMINEVKGYAYGNQVLTAVAVRLETLAKESDTLARIGNDEFALWKSGAAGYQTLYQEIQELSGKLNETYRLDGEDLYLSIRMGISICPSDGSDHTDIFDAAVSALNRAKAHHSAGYQFYNKQLNQELVHNYLIQKRLRDALDREEFILHYQPKVDMQTQQIIGMEALIRWEREGEMVAPNDFIPLAESTQLIVPIGEWVLRQACRFAYELYAGGKEIPVAVNLSRIQFRHPYIVKMLDQVLRETKLPPRLLQLEITESILMDHADECRWLIEELKEKGFVISIDDFGTGYSSLSYLKKFAVDQVKIDRAFIKDIPEKDSGVIAKVIIELADNFGLDVIAEGVETRAQEAFLLHHRCIKAQGYLYHKPMTESAVRKLIT